jgi:hypothetical protein
LFFEDKEVLLVGLVPHATNFAPPVEDDMDRCMQSLGNDTI